MIVVVMGVCGCGKTTVGRALSRKLGWEFLDADDFHPETNVAKMAVGIALTDDDRWPWLDRIAQHLRTSTAHGRQVVLACSALKQAYRDRLALGASGGDDIRFVYLEGDASTIAPRLSLRGGHFMSASLLASQFAALEESADAIVVDIRNSVETQVGEIAAQLKSTLSSTV